MTFSSGLPYQHGQPRVPNQPHISATAGYMHTNYLQNQQQTNNGFSPVALSVPIQQQQPQHHQQQQNVLPMQPIRPIQPVQGIPQVNSASVSGSPNAAAVVGGVSFAPGGKTGTGGAGYVQQPQQAGSNYGGSMESLNSTISSTLSFGSTISTGKSIGGVG